MKFFYIGFVILDLITAFLDKTVNCEKAKGVESIYRNPPQTADMIPGRKSLRPSSGTDARPEYVNIAYLPR